MFKKIRYESLYVVLAKYFFSDLSNEISSRADVVYTPTSTLFPFDYDIPSVLSVHDIQHEYFPEFFSEKELLQRTLLYKVSLRKASYVQASSTFVMGNLLEKYFFLNADRIFVIPEGVDVASYRSVIDVVTVTKKYNLPDLYLFYPAQLWYHKDHITLFKALLYIERVYGQRISLVMTGAEYSAAAVIRDYIDENKMQNVLYLGKVPFEDLLAIYKGAKVLVHTSLYESSCLPVLEAAAAGIPIIASDIPPNIEMSQKIHMNLFRRSDHEDLARVILKMINADELMGGISSNLTAVEMFDWKRIAAQYIDIFELKA